MNLKKNIARLATAAMVASSLVSMSPAALAADSQGIALTLGRAEKSVSVVTHVLTVTTLAGTTGSVVIDFAANGANNMAIASVTSDACSGGNPDAVMTDADTLTVSTLAGCTNLTVTFVATNPAAVGSYMFTLSGATTGQGAYAIVNDDTITVSATVDPSITFDVGADTGTCNASWTSSAYAVDFGRLLPGTIASSDTNANATSTTVAHICTKLSTNATSGAVVTAKNANGANGLVSASKPADKIPSVTGAIAAGTPKYGMCVTATGGHNSAGTPAPVAPNTTGTAFLNTAACSSAAATINAFDGTAQNVWNVTGPANQAYYQMNLQVAISGTQPAHNDYADSITFVATATF